MTLQNLFRIFGKIDWNQTSADFIVQGVTSDSRKVEVGFVFVAIRGTTTDGHDHIDKAIAAGACALVVEQQAKVPSSFRGAVLQVLDAPMTYSELLSSFYSHPEEKLLSIAITGTNGKTSSSYMIEAILNEAHVPCGVMGTIDHHLVGENKAVHHWKSALTTPDAATFYKRLQEFVDLGAKAYVMEVSSHSLKQKRVPTHFDVALFTNFTRDHLDYHQTMEDYFLSKQLLFTQHLKKSEVFAILNADDPAVAKTKIAAGATCFTFGQSQESDFSFQLDSVHLTGMQFTVRERNQGSFKYETTMVGLHNIYNCVGAIAVARSLGVSHDICARALKKFTGVPGRLQRVPNHKNRHVFIDYAHTPDALEKVLESLANLKGQGKLITVFGCGGDRDQGKRPLMLQAAQKYSDKIVVTSDNPRSEDPNTIIAHIVAGADLKNIATEVDREKALHKALLLSSEHDVILVAGKGHEDYQIIGKQTVSFSDFQKMTTLLETLK